MRVPVYNGNTDVIGIFSWTIDIDLAGHLSQSVIAAAVPYNLYDPNDWKFAVGTECLIEVWCDWFVFAGIPAGVPAVLDLSHD